MPAVYPNDLKKSNWEAVRKTLPDSANKDEAAVGPALDGLQASNNAVNWTILDQCVDNANKALDSEDRKKIIAGAQVQLNKLPAVNAAAAKVRTALVKLAPTCKGVPGFVKMSKGLEDFDNFITGFKSQTETQLKNSESQAANRAGALNLDKVLATPTLKAQFLAFLEKEHSKENLDFMMAIKANPDKAVYDKYVKSGIVNLPAAITHKLDAVYDPAIVRQTWKEAYDEIYNLLRKDTMTRFKKDLT